MPRLQFLNLFSFRVNNLYSRLKLYTRIILWWHWGGKTQDTLKWVNGKTCANWYWLHQVGAMMLVKWINYFIDYFIHLDECVVCSSGQVAVKRHVTYCNGGWETLFYFSKHQYVLVTKIDFIIYLHDLFVLYIKLTRTHTHGRFL